MKKWKNVRSGALRKNSARSMRNFWRTRVWTVGQKRLFSQKSEPASRCRKVIIFFAEHCDRFGFKEQIAIDVGDSALDASVFVGS